MIQVLTATEHYRKMPWKNGLGSTLEVARSHGEGLDDFDWRISIADVKNEGSFSYFPKSLFYQPIITSNSESLKWFSYKILCK